MRRGRWYNAKEQMFYFEKMVKLLSGEDGRIVRNENRTGQEIKKGDTLGSEEYLEMIQIILGKIKSREKLRLIYKYIQSIYVSLTG